MLPQQYCYPRLTAGQGTVFHLDTASGGTEFVLGLEFSEFWGMFVLHYTISRIQQKKLPSTSSTSFRLFETAPFMRKYILQNGSWAINPYS